MQNYTVYILKNPVGKFYVGQTANISLNLLFGSRIVIAIRS